MTSANTPPFWRDMATRQKLRREKAERENARLKLVLEGQIKLARSMEALLQKRARQQVSECAGHIGKNGAQGRTLDFLADKNAFDALLASIEPAYREVDEVFAANGLLGSETPTQDARMREGVNGMYLDINSNKLLPFSMDAVGTAVWNHFKGTEKHRGNLYEKAAQKLDSTDDTIMEDFKMEFMGKTTRVDFRVKQVLRRYIEADREVVVYMTSVHSLDEGKSRPFAGLGFAEKGYVVIKRPTAPALVEAGFTVLQMCSLVVPQKAESCSQDATAVGAFTEYSTTMLQEARTPGMMSTTMALQQEAMEHHPPSLAQLLDDDDSDGADDAEELQEMLESLTWPSEEPCASHGRKTRRARNDRYNELEFLRNKVQQMEEELQVLRLQHLDNMVPVSPSNAPAATLAFSSQAFGFPVSSPSTTGTSPIWDLAARQQRWRERAMRENTKLRRVLDTQANLARSMESELGKRIREQLAGRSFPFEDLSDMATQDHGPDFALETETTESLRRGLDTAFEELNTVFRTNGLGQLETSSTDARIRVGASGLYLDVFASKWLPFDFETTATAAWNHYQGIERRRRNPNQNLTQDEEGCSDTVMEEVAMKFTGKSTNADFRVRQGIRRYMEADRQVVVWVSKAEAVGEQSVYSDFAFIDKGYVVVKRPTSLEQLAQQDQPSTTLLQICCLISPQMTRGDVLDVTTAGAFTEFILSVMVASITATQELIEGMVLEEAKQLTNQQG
ncbi:M96 mating-specific protein [Phytophthora megakarya]|uniref:M96 mating-specific protein n=1 Tax=Phytophthora megakarya TaxID=4795 RepID=A0A225W4C8_9STRA|nr:M96 mating-specific protein [Phytophthora megakarya]